LDGAMKRADELGYKFLRGIIFLAGATTGCAMTGAGLAIRLQNLLPDGGLGAWFGSDFLSGMGWMPGRIGWVLVLEGIFWVAAMAAWGVRNRWGWWSAAAAAGISLAFFPGGTLVGIVVLALMIPVLIRERPWKAVEKQPAEGGAR
jgi:hypothetical protein